MDDFFGGMFDFNGDGQTDWVEQAAGFAILDEMDEEDEGGDDGLSIEVDVSLDDSEEIPGGSSDLADALTATDDAIQSVGTDIAALIDTLEAAKSALDTEEPEDTCSDAWEAWNEGMEKLDDLIGDLEIASDSAS